MTPDEALVICKQYNINPVFMDTSFSDSPKKRKFRMVFCVDSVISEGTKRDKLQITLIHYFEDAIDTNLCISPKLNLNGEKENDKYTFNEKYYDFALKEVSDVFSSDEFAKYCSMVGKDMAGGYVGISMKMVKCF